MIFKTNTIAMKIRLLTCLLLSALAACSSTPAVKDVDAAATFVVVRHAEKSTDDARDPSLSETGKARAQALARLLVDAPLSAAYATGFRRTQQTAQPAADAHGIKITIYDAKIPATTLAAQLRAAHAHGTVLVVGHSNTVPDIVAALSGQPVDAMSDDQYDLVYRISTGSDGKTTLTRDQY
jgi:broad specificity phosphatase PhoE